MTQRDESDIGATFQTWDLVRLTTLRVKLPGGDWLQLAVDAPNIDRNGAFVKLLDDLPVQALEGAEVELKVTWVRPPPLDDPDDFR